MGNEVFRKRVRDLRLKKQVTISALAKALSVTTNRINMWEKNGAIPRCDKLEALSQFFDVPIDYLLGNDSIEKKPAANAELKLLQRKLERLNGSQLRKAESVLRAVFGEVFS